MEIGANIIEQIKSWNEELGMLIKNAENPDIAKFIHDSGDLISKAGRIFTQIIENKK